MAKDQFYLSAAREFETLSAAEQLLLRTAAAPALYQLLNFEPRLRNHDQASCPLLLCLQSDQAGGEGDVRDIIVSDTEGWEIGISAKHRHEAVKHSRLSKSIDFGKKWLGFPCSEDYFREVDHVFERLSRLKTEGALWSQIEDKDSTIYGAILESFKLELLRIDQAHPGQVAGALASYLVGKKDFYKIIKLEQLIKIQAFNFNNSLNLPYKKNKAKVHLEKLKLPRRIVELDFKIESSGKKSLNTLELICDGGWQIALRIHNASSRVEPSLKFDIGLLGRPNSLETFHVMW